jgi:hypothetical protein
MPLDLGELIISEKRERARLVVILAAFFLLAIPTFWLWQAANAVRLATITRAPSFVPLWIQEFWLVVGLLSGASVVVGIWAFAQMARWGRVRQQLRILGPSPAARVAVDPGRVPPNRWP